MCAPSIQAYNPNAGSNSNRKTRTNMSLFGQFSLLRTATFRSRMVWRGLTLAEPSGCHFHLSLLKSRHPYPSSITNKKFAMFYSEQF